MSKENELVEMLVKEAGGWANLLHKTLQKIADKHDLPEAKKILELYLTYHEIVTVADQPITPRQPVPYYPPAMPAQGSSAAPLPVQPSVTSEVAVTGAAAAQTELSAPVVTPPEKKASWPVQVRLSVDNSSGVGVADGMLGLPEDERIQDITKVAIENEYGQAHPDRMGLITGSSVVSGKIRPNGQFQMVFAQTCNEARVTCMVEKK